MGNEVAKTHSHHHKGVSPMPTKSTKPAELSVQSTEALEVLRSKPEGATFTELKGEVAGLASAHLTALRTRGLIDCEDIEVIVQRKETVKRWFVK